MNILKALEGISAKSEPNENISSDAETKPIKPQTAHPEERINVMASVLERHERISNRVRASSRGK